MKQLCYVKQCVTRLVSSHTHPCAYKSSTREAGMSTASSQVAQGARNCGDHRIFLMAGQCFGLKRLKARSITLGLLSPGFLEQVRLVKWSGAALVQR